MKKNLSIKQFIIAVVCTTSSAISFSQNGNGNGLQNNQWKINGNAADTINFIGTTNLRDLKFRTNNIEHLRLTKEGDLGLGTTMPAGKLDVYGTTYIRQDLYLPQLSTPTILPNEILYIDPITGLVSRGSIEKIGNYSYEQAQQTKCEPGAQILHPTWQNGLNKIFYECPEVFVGIATNAPRVSLDVHGKIYGNSISIGADPFLNTSRFHLKASLNPTTNVKMMLIENSSLELLSLSYQGLLKTRNVEINAIDNMTPLIIQNSTQKLLQLDHSGLLHARRIKVDTDTWADFVFDENYSLMPLVEVNSFIKLNNHLPNVPSETEVKENGVDLLEMNKVLLQKVEELTLYLIDQDEELEKLNSQLTELKLQLKELEMSQKNN